MWPLAISRESGGLPQFVRPIKQAQKFSVSDQSDKKQKPGDFGLFATESLELEQAQQKYPSRSI